MFKLNRMADLELCQEHLQNVICLLMKMNPQAPFSGKIPGKSHLPAGS
mgnify:CR=1 FL=1